MHQLRFGARGWSHGSITTNAPCLALSMMRASIVTVLPRPGWNICHECRARGRVAWRTLGIKGHELTSSQSSPPRLRPCLWRSRCCSQAKETTQCRPSQNKEEEHKDNPTNRATFLRSHSRSSSKICTKTTNPWKWAHQSQAGKSASISSDADLGPYHWS